MSEKANNSDVIAGIITAQIGTEADADLIQNHMNEYFTRWPNYRGKFTQLEWYHIFLDFLDAVKSSITT